VIVNVRIRSRSGPVVPRPEAERSLEAVTMTSPIIFPRDLPLGSVAVDLEASYTTVRRQTEALCTPLATEDYVIQSMPETSPVRWHLAHTSWFFETFVLQPHLAGYRPFHPQFGFSSIPTRPRSVGTAVPARCEASAARPPGISRLRG
jgi:hypothetical protein